MAIQPAMQKIRFRTVRTVFALMLREMATTYGRSPGGYLWALLEPIAAITLLSIVFSIAFDNPPIGTNFAIFYASGYMSYMMYADITQKMGFAIGFSRPLLFYPSVTFVDALFGRLILNTMTHVIVFVIVVTGIVLFFDLNIIIDVPQILLAMALTMLLACGVGTFNCYMIERFPLWDRIWSILNKPLFIISGILFTFDSVPSPYDDLLWYNPLIHIIGIMRSGLFVTYDANYTSVLYVFFLSMGLWATGMLLLRRFHRDLLNN
ncbi:ABC transporter permease [Pseudaestuariivita rosea]|uniref:ABC transporter permease n=1 Tax=Pseudaestuariivita rosea TaxID=2763263 RepID=UPI001ABA059E|nr:ABC transporter permease [Pseudaestuariivita rosea]